MHSSAPCHVTHNGYPRPFSGVIIKNQGCLAYLLCCAMKFTQIQELDLEFPDFDLDREKSSQTKFNL